MGLFQDSIMAFVKDRLLRDDVTSIRQTYAFYYRRISMFVFFHVAVCSLLLARMLSVGVKTLYNTHIEIK